jgi:hypothetical protein
MGDERGCRPLAQRRGELLRPSRPAELARAEPRLHPEDGPPGLRGNFPSPLTTATHRQLTSTPTR